MAPYQLSRRGKQTDEEEQVSFLGSGNVSPSRNGHNARSAKRVSARYLLVVLVTAVVLLGRIKNALLLDGGDVVSKAPLFTCPDFHPNYADNEGGEDFEDVYVKASRNTPKSKKEFLETFREQPYDGNVNTYTFKKQTLFDFKSKHLVPNLKPGMKIYESAMGIGLNLFMTLEILQESENISGITVYGNEYVRESVEQAEFVLDEGVIPSGNQKGVLCAGDSTNLSHVPSNSFDLVYTGYITPRDALDIEDDDKWTQICDGADQQNWMAEELRVIGVLNQEDWFGKWVAEMARIAKPGAPVIAEEVSQPTCDAPEDWDGVSKSFWYEAAKKNTYDWNIDPDSIEMMDHTGTRYNVFMRKLA